VPVPSAPPAADLLTWYDRHRRILPWRAAAGETADPYHVWLSEIMLQQTTVAAVIPYYRRFLARFPDVAALAAAEDSAVMQAWAGLGYYARARNLLACARAVAARGGRFPETLEGLRALPGVGPYTAAAIGAIAFAIPVVPVDGNVERVAARVFAIEALLPAGKPAIAAAAARLGEDAAARARPADFAQALFDLGATVCTPAAPTCVLCPWQQDCAARRRGLAGALPRRAAKARRPLRHGAHFWLQDAAGRILLRERPATGLLGGMMELPGTPWREAVWAQEAALALSPMPAAWRMAGRVRHVFTHFELHLDVFAAQVARIAAPGTLVPIAALDRQALPSVMRKCINLCRPVATTGARVVVE
jgi:A/G-specific adenine glycosylase